MNNGTPNSWPELTYRFVEHYKWEPQHLHPGKSAAIFQSSLRNHEVPLNFFLNLYLRLSKSETIQSILNEFVSVNDQDVLELKYPAEKNYTQPDCLLESATKRIFIESKIGAKIRLEQVQKYLLLHADIDTTSRTKKPYLLFLTTDPFHKCWYPQKQIMPSQIDADFLARRLREEQLPEKLRKKSSAEILKRYQLVIDEVQFGFCTWQTLGSSITALVSRWHQTDREIEIRLTNDLISDLLSRRLFVPTG